MCVATSRDCRIGVDIERVDDSAVSRPLEQAVLNVPENVWVHHSSDCLPSIPSCTEGRPERFFHLWCRKEAVLKGLGVGLAIHPREVSVLPESEVAGECAVTVGESRWWVRSCVLTEGRERFVLALATDMPGVKWAPIVFSRS